MSAHQPQHTGETSLPSRPSDPHAEYARRFAERQKEQQRCIQLDHRIGNIRLLVFLAGLGFVWFVLRPGMLSWGWILPVILGFAGLVIAHERVKQQRLHAERSVVFYDRGLARLEDRWVGNGEPGRAFLSKFLEDGHPYAADLDLFGPGSAFELLCTARTSSGRHTLASWLCTPVTSHEIRARQQAIDELCLRLDLREELAIDGDDVETGITPEALTAWGSAPIQLSGWWLPGLAALLSAISILTLVAWGTTPVGPVPFLLAFLVQSIFIAVLRPRVQKITADIDRPGRELTLLSKILTCLEQEAFSCPWLIDLQTAIKTHGLPPPSQIARLNRLITLLESSRNQLFIPIAALLLWTPQIAFAIERWRAVSGQAVARWLGAIGAFEALQALSGYAYENPTDPFPEIVDTQANEKKSAYFSGKGLGHPLMPERECIRNDVCLGEQLQVLIVSGSNMSGKSTLLRTVGVNAVLALAGAPVRARQLRLSPLTFGATLRVQDSLHAGTSHFYAEITRVRQLMDLAEGPLPLLFLLDEIFHGTNSHDRQIGAAAVVRGLLSRGAIGLVTTHDLALVRIAEELAPRATNVCFEDQLVDGQLVFDYRMRSGVVQKSNALALMQSVGLEVT